MDSLDIVKFGIFDDFSHVFGTGAITNVIPLNHREMIISTTKEIIKIERSIIKMRHPIKFSTCAIVPDTDLLIGITTKKGEIVIYQIGDLPQTQQSYNSRSVELPQPILENYPTNQSGIFHMIYSPKSQSIITIGAGIKVFNFEYKLSRISVIKPTVSISHRSSFASDYYTTILVPPAFDSDSELLLLPTDEGICAFNLDGEKIMQCSKYPASVKTVYATHPSKPPKLLDNPDDKKKNYVSMSKKLLTYDSNKGMNLWGKKGQLIGQFNTIGSSVLAIMFIDSENALCLNSNHALFYLNIKTGKTFFCLNLEKNPSRVFLTFINKEPILCACFSSYMRALKIVIPWCVWNLNIDKAFLLCRCNKFRSAARVLIDSENSFIKFYSPRNGTKMTVATPAEAARSVSFLYDRGIVENYVFDDYNLKYTLKVIPITNNEKSDSPKNNNEPEKNEDDEKVESPGSGRDILFIILENGTILGFDTNVSNCEEVMKMKCKAAFMTICRIRSTKKISRRHHKSEEEKENDEETFQWCYAVASEKSDIFILDYFSMKEVRHFSVSDDKLIKMFFHFDTGCIVMVFERKTIMFDIEQGKIVSTALVGCNQIISMFANFLIFGYESGHIRRVSIENKQLVICDDNSKKKKKSDDETDEETTTNKVVVKASSSSSLQKPHEGPITGFSFSLKIWISSGLDGNVIVWDYNFEKVYKIVLPLPLKACLIMNGKRDILVATNTEVMLIKDKYLLDFFEEDPYDVEIEEIDNFDRIKDALCHDTIDVFDPDAYDNANAGEDEDEYSEEEDEEEKQKKKKKKIDLPPVSKPITRSNGSQPAKTNVEDKPQTKTLPPSGKKPNEDSKEDVQKKLEMMQAMNGISAPTTRPSVPAPSSHSPTAHSPKPAETKPPENKEKESPKVAEVKKKKPPKEGKNLNDFINNNIEQEKAQSKKKKVKKNNNQEKEQVKDEEPKKSEEEVANMIGNLFDRNKPKNQPNASSKKKTGEGIDFNELAKKFQKDEDQVVVNLDKADLSRKGKRDDEDEDEDEEDDDEQSEKEESSNKKKTNQTSEKPKQNTTTKANPKPTASNANANTNQKANAKPATSSSNTKANAKPKEKEKEKEKVNPKGNQASNENDNKHSSGKSKDKKAPKSSSSPKQQKEQPKASSKKNENNAQIESNNTNSSPKKIKNSSPPKSSNKPISSGNNHNNLSSTNPISSSSNPASSVNPSKTANSNYVPSNNSSNINSKSPANSNSVSNSNVAPKAAPSSTNNNNSSTNGDQNKYNNSNDDDVGVTNKPGKISIGTQGELFEDGNEDNNDNNDSMHLEVKMNGPNPMKTAETQQEEEAEEVGKEEAEEVNDTNNNDDEIVDDKEDASDNEEMVQQNELDNQKGNDGYKQSELPDNNKSDKISNNNNKKKQQDDLLSPSNSNENGVNENGNEQNEAEAASNDSDSRNQRPPTPPPVRPQISASDQKVARVKERIRPRTPPPKRELPPYPFKMPPPNVIIDQEAVLVLYGRGRLEFKPLVDRIRRDMMIGRNGNGYYTQNKRITLAYVQNYSESLKDKNNKNEDDKEENKQLSKTAQPIAPPITPPHPNSARVVRNDNDRSIFNGSTNSISPAFNNRKRKRDGLSNSMIPNSTPKEDDLNGVDTFNVSIENTDGTINKRPMNKRIPDINNSFCPAAYVYNYESNTETIFNDLDTKSAITTPRKPLPNEGAENENTNEEDETIISDSKSSLRSPRRIQSARATGRPLFINTAGHERQVKMPFPLSPIVMASPRRSIKKKQPSLADGGISNVTSANDEESSEETFIDQLESAVMTKMPKLNFTLSTPQSQAQYQMRIQESPSSNVSPNFGLSNNTQNYSRPNSVRTFDRSPLIFNQPIGAGMLRPGSVKKRNAAFYANVAVTTSISNARRSSPAYRTGSSRSKRQLNQNSRISGNSRIDDLSGFAKTLPNEIEITVNS